MNWRSGGPPMPRPNPPRKPPPSFCAESVTAMVDGSALIFLSNCASETERSSFSALLIASSINFICADSRSTVSTETWVARPRLRLKSWVRGRAGTQHEPVVERAGDGFPQEGGARAGQPGAERRTGGNGARGVRGAIARQSFDHDQREVRGRDRRRTARSGELHGYRAGRVRGTQGQRDAERFSGPRREGRSACRAPACTRGPPPRCRRPCDR